MSNYDVIEKSNLAVLKTGSVLSVNKNTAEPRHEWIESLASDVRDRLDQNKKSVVVASGAIALGRKDLGIPSTTPPSKITLQMKQAASAIGQGYLYGAFRDAFAKVGLKTAQVLLTMAETENRTAYLNARATLLTLLNNGIIPIINENDTISTEEIRYGDNDRLAVRVAQTVDADLVILLSTTDGLFTADPTKHKDAAHIPFIQQITDDHIEMAGDAVPGLSTGGMKSKIDAAVKATRAGITLMIASGVENYPLKRLEQGGLSTVFQATECRHNARKRWIQAHLNPKGSVFIDDGAVSALLNGKSLLPVGVKELSGTFRRGDTISIKSETDNKIIGMGIVAYNKEDALKIIGQSSQKILEALGYAGREELIHRDNLVLMNP